MNNIDYFETIANEEIRELAVEIAEKLKKFLNTSSNNDILVSRVLVEDAFMQHLRYNFYMDCECLRGDLFNPVEDRV